MSPTLAHAAPRVFIADVPAGLCAQILTREQFVQSTLPAGRAVLADALLEKGHALGEWWAQTAQPFSQTQGFSEAAQDYLSRLPRSSFPEEWKARARFLNSRVDRSWVPKEIGWNANQLFYAPTGELAGVGFASFRAFHHFVMDGGVEIFKEMKLHVLRVDEARGDEGLPGGPYQQIKQALIAIAPQIRELTVRYPFDPERYVSQEAPDWEGLIGSAIEQMPLEHLLLAGTGFTSSLIRLISHLDIPLKTLELNEVSFDGAMGRSLRDARFQLTDLSLISHAITDAVPRFFENASPWRHPLQALRLICGDCSDAAVRFIQGQKELRVLGTGSGIRQDDVIAAAISSLPQLQVLAVDGSRIIRTEVLTPLFQSNLPLEVLILHNPELDPGAWEDLIRTKMPLKYFLASHVAPVSGVDANRERFNQFIQRSDVKGAFVRLRSQRSESEGEFFDFKR